MRSTEHTEQFKNKFLRITWSACSVVRSSQALRTSPSVTAEQAGRHTDRLRPSQSTEEIYARTAQPPHSCDRPGVRHASRSPSRRLRLVPQCRIPEGATTL